MCFAKIPNPIATPNSGTFKETMSIIFGSPGLIPVIEKIPHSTAAKPKATKTLYFGRVLALTNSLIAA